MVKSKIKALGEIALRVNDLETMIEFYENIVGLKPMSRSDRHAFFEIAEGFAGHTQVLALFNRRNEVGPRYALSAEQSTIDHIAFTIAKDDFQSEDDRLKSLGITPTYAYHEWVQWRSLYFQDPEGNTVELVCHDPG